MPLIIAVTLACGGVGAIVANGGMKGLVAVAGAGALAGGLMLVRERERFVLVVTVMTIQFMLHKAFGPIDETVASGASAIYVTSLDALVVLLFALWIADGTFVEDLRKAFSSRIMLVPLLPIALSIPSLFVASNVLVALAELVRMAWMYGLFVYVATRVRTREDVGWVVAALFAVAVLQGAIVVAQWRTGGLLGLSFLGEEQGTFLRTLDESEVVRPSGTVIHPDLLAALVGPIGLLGLALAMDLRRGILRIVALAGAVTAFVPLALSHTRAALAALAVATLLLVLWYTVRGRLRRDVLFGFVALSAVATIYFWPTLQEGVFDTLTTDHFKLEVEARLQLNGIALAMMSASPLVGIGLNNFMTAFDSFDLYGVIYPGFPAHNLYLIVFAETGILGFIGLVAVLYAFLRVALHVASAPDRFLGAVGGAMAVGFVFLLVEELLSFSLRGDIPSALYWLMAGLCVACARIVDSERLEAAHA